MKIRTRLFSLSLILVLILSLFPVNLSAKAGALESDDTTSFSEYYKLLSTDEDSVISADSYIPDDTDLALYGHKDATIITYSSGEEGLAFRIPLSDSYEYSYPSSEQNTISSDVNLNYIDAELVGDGNGNLKIKLWCAEPLKDTNLTFRLYYGTCRDEKPQNIHKQVFDIKSLGTILNPTIINDSISTTKYFMMELTGRYLGMDDVKWQSYNVLFNKKASKYPSYTCQLSNQLCVKPYYSNFKVTPVEDREKWTTSDRNNYIKYFNETYNGGKAPWNWSDYQIHHIRPIKYGGKNTYSNLIPIPTTTHRLFNSWWSNY